LAFNDDEVIGFKEDKLSGFVTGNSQIMIKCIE
jgi:hypothetical protein